MHCFFFLVALCVHGITGNLQNLILTVHCVDSRGTHRLLCSQAADFPGQEQVQYAQVQADCSLHEQGCNLPGTYNAHL